MTALQIRAFKPGESACGIYFLLTAGRVIYIGQSVDISRRVETHRKTLAFDEVKLIEVERKDLDSAERKFILEMKPERNGFMRGGRRDYCAPGGPVPTPAVPRKPMTPAQLQKLIDRAGISQRGAAKAIDINERHMRRYVAGDAVIPRTVELACKYLWEKIDGK